MPRHTSRDQDHYEDDYTGETGAYRDYYTEEHPDWTDERSMSSRAMAPVDSRRNLPAKRRAPATVIIQGTGSTMGEPFIPRRKRPLTMRVVVITLMVCVVATGLFAAAPLAANSGALTHTFRALSGAVALRGDVNYRFYAVAAGDTPESLAKKFNCQVGGIYELNAMAAGQELQVGSLVRIPNDPLYGKSYTAPSLYSSDGAYGTTTYGTSSWSSLAGDPPPEVSCGPDGHGTPTGYQLQAPNKGSHWVRGFTWYHNGVDMAAPAGNTITAAQAGEVIWAGWANDGFGFSVKINHCNHVSTMYGHMEQLLVKVHDVLRAGDPVGLEGSTGWSTGPHLHFMVEWNNVPIDPMPYYNYSQSHIVGLT
jgi:murein DD-endopeptidase MepM/ murein hydrolase activator NlpD